MVKLVSFLLLFSYTVFANLLPDEKKTIGTYVPDILLEIHTGKKIPLRVFGEGKPMIINPIYTKCSSACPLMTEGLKKVINDLKDSVKVISFSIDPRDNLEDLKRFAIDHNLPDNWVVAKSPQANTLLKAIDFRYIYDQSLGEFDHPNFYVIITPTGKISRYIYGVNPRRRDLVLAILEAKRENVRLSPVEGFFLRCFRYDPERGTYEVDWFFVFDVIGGLLTFFLIPTVVWGGSLYRSLHDFIVKKS